MSLKQLVIWFALLGVLTVWPNGTFGQAPAGHDDFAIKDIRQLQLNAPTYSATGVLGGRPSTLWRIWLEIEAQFESKAEWADDVQLKFYVLVKGAHADESRLFVGDVTHVNVAKGSQHYSAMFIQPNTLRRYSAGQIERVAVRLFHNGALVSTLSVPPSKESWWERYSPTPGYLLPPQETPWAPIADDRFEAIKPNTRQ